MANVPKKNKRCQYESVRKRIQDVDIFGTPVGFNLDGDLQISSFPGFIMTCIVMTILFSYGAARFQTLIYRSNPTITRSDLLDYFDSTEIVKFSDINFKIAFAVEQYDDSRAGKDDPNYVRWVVQLTQTTGGVEIVIPLKYHKCSDADFDSYYKPGKSYINVFAQAKKRKNLYCIDDDQDLAVYGYGDQTDY